MFVHGVSGRGMRSTVVVPTDGPGAVYVPTTLDHFGVLGVPSPSLCYPCGDIGGNVLPSIGSLELPPTGSVSYSQSVSGWDRPFLYIGAGNNGWVSGSTRSLAEGASGVFVAYVGCVAVENNRILVGPWGSGNAGSGPTFRANNNTIPQVRTNNVGANINTTHAPLTTIRPYLVARDAVNDLTRIWSPIGTASTTHYEASISGQVFRIGSSNSPEMYCGWLAVWDAVEAAALIAAGLANETLLSVLGWELSY
jgi:hypothetical protein